jgi:hypothetical protein
VVELTHPGSNPIFDMVFSLRLIILLAGGDISVDSETFFVTDFMNLKIKPTQSFGGAHRDRVYVCMFIGVSARTCISICVYTVFLKKSHTAGEN